VTAMTRIFDRQTVRELLTLDDCIAAIESVFRRFGEGTVAPPRTVAIHVPDGGFHIKAAVADSLFAAKINANFPANPRQHALPTIQGVVIVCDAHRGTLLAIMDSAEITTLRTAAASAVAAKHLARSDASIVTICGCGVQGRAHLDALARVRQVRRAFAVDADTDAAARFAADARQRLGIDAEPSALNTAVAASEIVVTCTPSRAPFIQKEHLHPGLFIAAVGADNPEKSEIAPDALAASFVVTDVLEQSAAMGDLHHAIAAGRMRPDDVHATLGQVVAGSRPGRRSEDEIFIFDSTGTALQDVAAAEVVYRRGIERGAGVEVALA